MTEDGTAHGDGGSPPEAAEHRRQPVLRRIVEHLRLLNDDPRVGAMQFAVAVTGIGAGIGWALAHGSPGVGASLFVVGVTVLSFWCFRHVGSLSDGAESRDACWYDDLSKQSEGGDSVPEVKPSRYERITYALTALNGRIITEYSTVSERTGWLLVSQSFLMAALATMANNSVLCEGHRLLILRAIAVSGLGIAVLLGTGIALTHRNCELLKVDRGKLEQLASKYCIPRTGVATAHPVHFIGHLASRALPSLAMAIWATALFLIEFGVLDAAAGGKGACPGARE